MLPASNGASIASEVGAMENRLMEERERLAAELHKQLSDLCNKCIYRQIARDTMGRLDKLEREMEELKRKK